MPKYNLTFCFFGTGCKYQKNIKPYGSYKNVGDTKNWSDRYIYFNGPNVLNTGPTSTTNMYKQAIELIPKIIEEYYPDDQENILNIIFQGHSRGSTTCNKAYTYVRAKYISYKNIKFTLKISDSYFGPTAKNENALIRLDKSDLSLSSNLTIATYAAQTLFRCTPQQIVNIDIVIIVNTGHNMSGIALWDPPKVSGLYIAYLKVEKKNIPDHKKSSLQKRFGLNKVKNIYSCRYVLISRAAEPIKEFFDFIYKYGKITQTNRWRLFTAILIQKLGLKSYDDLEKIAAIPKSILFPNVIKEFNTAISSIGRSINLSSAFNTAIKLFLPGGIFSGMGGSDFHRHLSNAQNCVCGIKNNSPVIAINELSLIINKPGRPEGSIKSTVANALISRIKKWYNLK